MTQGFIIILGATPSSEAMIALLNQYDHAITLIDTDADKLAKVASKYDIQTICHTPSHPDALIEANITDATVLITNTRSDEMNLTACHVATSLNSEIKCFACLKNNTYLWEGDKPNYAAPINKLFSYTQSVYEDIHHLLELPSAKHISKLGNNLTALSISVIEDHPLNGKTLEETVSLLPEGSVLTGLYRQKQWTKYRKNIKLTEDDDILVITPSNKIGYFIHKSTSYKSILCLGISDFTHYVCQQNTTFPITVIERNENACHDFAEKMPDITVINDDPQDPTILSQYALENALVIAGGPDDEDNLVSSFQAHDSGAYKVFTLINHIRGGHVFETGPLDYIINAPQVICDEIIRDLLAKFDVSHFYTKHNYLQIAKIRITQNHAYLGKSIQDISLDTDIFVGCIIRNGSALFTSKQDTFELDDEIVIYSNHVKNQINPIESLLLHPKGLFKIET